MKSIMEKVKVQLNDSLNELKHEVAINSYILENHTMSCMSHNTDNHNGSQWIRVAYLDMKNSTHQCPNGPRIRNSLVPKIPNPILLT